MHDFYAYNILNDEKLYDFIYLHIFKLLVKEEDVGNVLMRQIK